MICHLIDSNLGSAYFRSIARGCNKAKYPVMIGSIAPDGELQKMIRDLQTPTFSLQASKRRQYPLALKRLVQLLRSERVSLLHAHCFDPTFVGLLAARLAGIPFIFTRHHSDHNIRINKKWHTRIDSWCARNADHVIAVSEVTKRIMTDIENVSADQITVVYNGMEPLRQPTPETIEQTRQSIEGLAGHIILMIARLHEEKGHRFLFAALPQIISQVGSVTVVLAGDGPQRTEIEAQAQQAGVLDKIRFLGQRRDIPELISLSSVVVLPSLAESFGFALLEAMSLGKPVVAAATGGIPEVVKNGISGQLVPQGEHSPLAAAIIRILTDQSLADSYGRAGQEQAAKFTFEQMICGYEKVYDKTIKLVIKNRKWPLGLLARKASSERWFS